MLVWIQPIMRHMCRFIPACVHVGVWLFDSVIIFFLSPHNITSPKLWDMSGDKYIAWCGSLRPDSWFKQLAVHPTAAVTVRFLSCCYCAFCHFIKAQTSHTFERCAAPLHKNSIWGGTSIRTRACTEPERKKKEKTEPSCTSACICSRGNARHRGEPRLHLTWCTAGWDHFVHMLKHRQIYNSPKKKAGGEWLRSSHSRW